MSDAKVIYWDHCKKNEKRPVGRPRKYDNSTNCINKLHDFSDLFEFDKWYDGKYFELPIESTEPNTTWKKLSFFLKKKMKSRLFWAWELWSDSKSTENSRFHCLENL